MAKLRLPQDWLQFGLLGTGTVCLLSGGVLLSTVGEFSIGRSVCLWSGAAFATLVLAWASKAVEFVPLPEKSFREGGSAHGELTKPLKMACGGLVATEGIAKGDGGASTCSKGCRHDAKDMLDAMGVRLEEMENAPKPSVKFWLTMAAALALVGLRLFRGKGASGMTVLGHELGLFHVLGRDWTGIEVLVMGSGLLALAVMFGAGLKRVVDLNRPVKAPRR